MLQPFPLQFLLLLNVTHLLSLGQVSTISALILKIKIHSLQVALPHMILSLRLCVLLFRLLNWSDLLLSQELDSPRKSSITSYPENGSFTLQLPLKAGHSFVVSMSDASGFATGGISDLYTVGASISGDDCTTDTPALSFLFDLPSPLNQCK
jgi:hypothetical protein